MHFWNKDKDGVPPDPADPGQQGDQSATPEPNPSPSPEQIRAPSPEAGQGTSAAQSESLARPGWAPVDRAPVNQSSWQPAPWGATQSNQAQSNQSNQAQSNQSNQAGPDMSNRTNQFGRPGQWQNVPGQSYQSWRTEPQPSAPTYGGWRPTTPQAPGNQPYGVQPPGSQPYGGQPSSYQPGGYQSGGYQPGGYQPGGYQSASSQTPPWQQTSTWPSSDRTQSKARRGGLGQALILLAVCAFSLSAGMVVDHTVFPATATPNASPASSSSLENMQLFNQALSLIKRHWVGIKTTTDQQLLYGAIRGMVEALGDTGHSVFLTPDEYKAYIASLNASVAGIGVILEFVNNQYSIEKVIPNGPADKAGVKSGDVIEAIDGTPTENMTMDDVSGKIRGDAGTSVTLTLSRAGVVDPLEIKITRDQFTVPLIYWGMVPGTHVADINLTEFSQGASAELATAIKAATAAGATSMVLDLRGNPGGYAQEAVDVASEFISSGTVYIEQDGAGNRNPIQVDPKETFHTDLPMEVLVDHDSASASEIVAGSLQDHGRAKIVGVSTFGTGTVLQPFPLADGSVIFLGTEYWLTPNGHKLFGVGVTPDENVTLPANTFPLDPYFLPTMSVAQYQASNDAQLFRAVSDLNS